jgi:hypothetical protein
MLNKNAEVMQKIEAMDKTKAFACGCCCIPGTKSSFWNWYYANREDKEACKQVNQSIACSVNLQRLVTTTCLMALLGAFQLPSCTIANSSGCCTRSNYFILIIFL